MKEYFKDVRGWIALGTFIVALCVLGFTKMLARRTNLTLVLILLISVVIMVILTVKKPQQQGPTEGEDPSKE